MRQVLERAAFLLRRPAVWAVAVVVSGGGMALVRLPLFGLPGFELALALTVAIGLLGPITGGVAAFLERRLIQGRDPRPKGATRHDSPAVAAYRAIAAASLVNAALLVPPLLFATLYAITSTACDPFEHIGFVALLPLPSAVVSAAVGAFCGFAARRRLTGFLLFVLLLVGSLAWTVWPIVFGPQVFAFNHLLGHLPGPLYDEAIAVTSSLLWFRLQSLVLAACLWLFITVHLSMSEGRLTAPKLRPGPMLLLGALAICVAALEARAPELGFRSNDAFVMETLGGRRESAHFELLYARAKPKQEVDRAERDLEFRYAQLSQLLGAGPSGKLRVFLYPSADVKQRLVGAGHTQFAKPWRGDLHVNDARFPHPVLKHELAHLMAAPLGSGPFGVTTRYGLLPVMGVVEGLAVAADDRTDELTLHQWAAGMRKQGLAPDVRDIVGPRGFYRSAPSRAYTLVGSFLRYLADTYGPEKLRALYARADFESSYGRTLDALASEWEKFLESVPVSAAEQNQAFARFRQGSLFTRTCAREVATLYGHSMELLASAPDEALDGFRRAAELQPEEPSYVLGEATALARLGRGDEALAALAAVADRVRGKPALEAEVEMAQADIAAETGKVKEAATFLQSVLRKDTSAAIERTARVKLAALGSPVTGPAVWAYFRTGGADELKLLRLREALDRDPADARIAYLLGRRLLLGGEPGLAGEYLDRALRGELEDVIRREALRLRLEAAYLAGDCHGVRDQAGRMPDLGEPTRRQADEWVARCEFEERTYKGPLVPEVPFR